jgi:DNA-binding SARP family transcriptional activator
VIRLFGALEIEDGPRKLGARDLGGSRPKQVLEFLLAARGHCVTTDRLADLLWGDRQPQDPPGSLQTFVSVLRRRLAPDRDRARELVITETERPIALRPIASRSISTASISCSSARRTSRRTPPAALSNGRLRSCAATSWRTSVGR